jgi:hypothetical protein
MNTAYLFALTKPEAQPIARDAPDEVSALNAATLVSTEYSVPSLNEVESCVEADHASSCRGADSEREPVQVHRVMFPIPRRRHLSMCLSDAQLGITLEDNQCARPEPQLFATFLYA